jgi:hypothetical protein
LARIVSRACANAKDWLDMPAKSAIAAPPI